MSEPRRGQLKKSQAEHDVAVIALETKDVLIKRLRAYVDKLDKRSRHLRKKLRCLKDDRYWLRREINRKVKL